MLELIIAFGLDLLLGDPPYAWHPVRMIGKGIQQTESWLRARIPDVKLAGLIQAVLIPSAVYIFVWFLTEVAFQFSPLLKSLLVIYFFYSSISIKDLSVEARRVHYALRNGKIDAARKNLARIVGRDTGDLNEAEIIRATVETVAESFVDGVLSPLFFAAWGGAPLVMAYKTINTLDSMVGLRTPQYQEYGQAAARLDAIVNWIPARISWFLIGLGAFFMNGRLREAWHVASEELSGAGLSNGVLPEAAFAGALGIELGGTNYYSGEKYDSPKLGIAMRSLEPGDIRRAVQLMKTSSWIALAGALLLHFLASFIFS